MKASKLREMTVEELGDRQEELEKQLLTLRFQLSTKQIENPMKIRELRRDIARLRTVQRERGLENH
ncbi:MAG: 50S ribosomal protein L29 [Acidobacteriota bacterium]